MKKIPVIGSSARTYTSESGNRLPAEDIATDQLYRLMMENEDEGLEAYVADVGIRRLQMSQGMDGHFIELLFLDRDKQPVYAVDSVVTKNGFWKPERPPINATYSRLLGQIAIFEGYILLRDYSLDVDEEGGQLELTITDAPKYHSLHPITDQTVA